MFNWLKKVLPAPEATPHAIGEDVPSDVSLTHSDVLNKCAAYKKQGNEFLAKGMLEEAAESYRQAIAINPDYAEGFLNVGFVLKEQKHYEEAERHLKQAVLINPKMEDAYYILGTLAQERGNLDEAVENYTNALDLKPDFENVYRDLYHAFSRSGKNESAKRIIKQGISIYPESAEFCYYLGHLHVQEGDLDQARACYQKVLSLQPEHAEVHCSLGDIFKHLGDLDEAQACYYRALELNPNNAVAHNNLGTVFQDRGDLDQAQASYRKALALKPDYSMAYNNLGILFQENGRLDEALTCYRQAVEWASELHEAKINLLHLLQHMCAWKDLGLLSEEVRRVVLEAPPIKANRISPFSFLTVPGSTALEQRICADNWAQRICEPLIPRYKKMGFKFTREPKQKINVGYLSADFGNHPASYLMAQIFELHDRDRFRISAYSYRANDGGVMRERLEKAFDQFIDIRALSDESAAKKIYDDKIDILVDLTGYTTQARSAITALRPAPIRVNYLGYPGTMGAGLGDYLIADQFIIPPGQKESFAEKVVWLPNCYQPRDASCRRLAAPSRVDCGLPEEGFVFCSFNQAYKITPDIFDIWCRLLKAVPGSVLWLLSSNPDAESNLSREAVSRGVAPERIVIASKLNLEEHLARIQCADLFLDTTPINAHTTCSDALWMGLPVITYVGETFPSRVAGSLLTAMEMPELITYSLQDYYTLALSLATDGTKYENIRNKILANLGTAPLFDSTKFTRDLENVYLQMWDEYARTKDHQICPH